MKIIHTADLHLGSSMGTRLSGDKSGERKMELRDTFRRIADFAVSCGAAAVLLSGDVFDEDIPFTSDKAFFYHTVLNHPSVNFYYLKGNHDSLGTGPDTEIPNLYTFDDSLTEYRIGNVSIYGSELSDEENPGVKLGGLSCDPSRINIVMLHGQVGSGSGDIKVRDFADKNIDYLALGHIHSFAVGEIDSRGKYVYPGTPEGRGFDETGPKGFVLLDTGDSGYGIDYEFIPFAKRTIYEIPVDVSSADTKEAAMDIVMAAVSDISGDNIVRVLLTGDVLFDTGGLPRMLETMLSGDFYFAGVKDKTMQGFDMELLSQDQSIRGEFVRALKDDPDVPEDMRKNATLMGLKALDGTLPAYLAER